MKGLLLRLGGCVAGALLLVGLFRLWGLELALPLPVALALAIGGGWWLLSRGIESPESLDAPDLDLDADYALPHAQDMRVRRLEDLVHGAQPSRRMTARGLGRVLGQIAEEQDRDPSAPPLGAQLAQLLDEARHPDAEAHPIRAIDRRDLHRYIRELAAREERDR